ncbi:exodeoxyribonuclease V subunit beta [Marinospirillum perlucidum]|uniref:exodeoxyribonuclease V subunit beta n=1 Tax=Marinospirillum perlucidum TaxID=1982602 RepID=UPI000DF2B226|nr:exodeoxyribonuclease V subunit beta [Marinospirillum perlucidum]
MSQTLNLLDFPLRGSQLIEASAGTGKTFTLALLYTRLVLGHGQEGTAFHRPLTPREILVVTFTEAAAEELRDRIRARLVEAAQLFQSQADAQPEEGPLEALKASYPPGDWPKCAWQLQLAAESMDEANISTIHSWCNRMLVEHAFDTRGLFNRELVTDTSDLFAEVVRDYWRVHFYPLQRPAAELITTEFASPDSLEKALWPLMSNPPRQPTYRGQPLVVEELQPHLEAQLEARQAQAEATATLKAAWLKDWQEITAYLHEIRTSFYKKLAQATPEAFDVLLEKILNWAQGSGEKPKELNFLALGHFPLLTKAKDLEIRPFEAFRLQAEALETDATPSTSQPLRPLLLAHAAPWVAKAYQQRLKERAEMGFDDLLIQLEAALNPDKAGDSAEQLAAILRKAFPVAMIDEFQDTDPVQFAIFQQIYRLEKKDPDTGLIMIGDPKQAIYSFRGADIHTYLQARQATEGRHHTLKRNFRSSQGMVEAVNQLFAQAEENYPAAAFRFQSEEGDNPLPFVQVEAAGRDEELYLEGQPAAAMTCWQFHPEEGKSVIGMQEYRDQAAASAASQVVQWLQAAQEGKAGFGQEGQITQPLQASDLAILVKNATEARAIRQQLRKRQVASVYLSDRESVFSSQEAADLLHWLAAVAEPGQEKRVRAALGSNTLRLPLDLLALWQEDELAWEEQMDLFSRLRRIWQRQGVLAMLRRLMESYQLPARLLQEAEGERILTNLLHLAEWLQEASTQLDGEQALIRHLAEHLDAPDEQQLLRLESDADLIKVVTIHKSKGLEYPLVLLPFISSWREINGKIKQQPWDNDQGRFVEISDPKTFPLAWNEAKQRTLNEDLRLLYVAVTRARHACWLGVAPLKSGNSKKPQLERSALGYLLAGGASFASPDAVWESLEQLAQRSSHLQLQAAPAINNHCLPGEEGPQLEPARSPEHLPRLTPWWIASYSALGYSATATSNQQPQEPETAEEATAAETAQEPKETRPRPALLQADQLMDFFPAGSRYGTFLHNLLEWAAAHQYQDLRGFAAAAADDCGRLEVIRQRCRTPDLESLVEPLSAWLKDFLQLVWKPLPGHFSLSGLKPEQLAVEMEFLLASHCVDITTLDQMICQATLEAAPRPAAEAGQLNGFLKGFIDLVAYHQGRYYVIDWKSNKLGASASAYSQEELREALLKKRYDLQYVLYILALHRLLKNRLPDYDYDRHLGGAVYVFLRGSLHEDQGLFMDKPPAELIWALDRLFSKDKQEAEA